MTNGNNQIVRWLVIVVLCAATAGMAAVSLRANYLFGYGFGHPEYEAPYAKYDDAVDEKLPGEPPPHCAPPLHFPPPPPVAEAYEPNELVPPAPAVAAAFTPVPPAPTVIAIAVPGVRPVTNAVPAPPDPPENVS